jgi:nicotinate-nucleotide adenylyltransferase
MFIKVYHQEINAFSKTLGYTNRMSQKKIGLFGGTFDPLHAVHLILAGEAAHQLGLSHLYWVLTPDPPHKQEQLITPLAHRLEMLQLGIADNPMFELSRLEIDRPGPHYTVDTIRLMAEQQPDAEIVLLLGGDSLRDLPTWRFNTELVAAVSKIGVMSRPSDPFDMPVLETKIPGLTEKVILIDALFQNVSSHEIRRRVMSGDMFRYYVSPPVYDYIVANHLYLEKQDPYKGT